MPKVFSLGLLCFFLISTYASSQDSYFKASLKGTTYDNISDLSSLDDSYAWNRWSALGLTTLGLEVQKKWNNKISYKSQIGLSAARINYFYTDDSIRVVNSYHMSYLNLCMTINYHFNENHRGFQVGIGPSFYKLVRHGFKNSFNNRTTNPDLSPIRDRLNDLPVLIQMELCYSFKLIKFTKKVLGLEIGYTPSIKLNGFINGYSSSPIMYRGIRLSANIWFDGVDTKEM